MKLLVKKIRIWLFLLLVLLSLIAGFVVSPFFGFFQDVYTITKLVLVLLLLIGCFGYIVAQLKLLFFGIVGCWLFIIIIIGTIVPDEEYYFYNNIDLPSKEFVVIRLCFLVALAISLLGAFRYAQIDIKSNQGKD